jgi:hypothetical protein
MNRSITVLLAICQKYQNPFTFYTSILHLGLSFLSECPEGLNGKFFSAWRAGKVTLFVVPACQAT